MQPYPTRKFWPFCLPRPRTSPIVMQFLDPFIASFHRFLSSLPFIASFHRFLSSLPFIASYHGFLPSRHISKACGHEYADSRRFGENRPGFDYRRATRVARITTARLFYGERQDFAARESGPKAVPDYAVRAITRGNEKNLFRKYEKSIYV
jgi:hypothetical protein